MEYIVIIVLLGILLVSFVKPKFYQKIVGNNKNFQKVFYFGWLILFAFSMVAAKPPLGEIFKSLGVDIGGEVNIDSVINDIEKVEPKTEPALETIETIVTKVIDGDTVVVAGGEHVRLLGIDAHEREESCYQVAKSRLEELILMKNVTLKPDLGNKDQYGRLLRFIYLENENINFKLVKEGLAICRFYDDNPTFKKDCAPLEIAAIKEGTGCVWKEKQ